MPYDRRRFQLKSERPGEETLRDEQKVRILEIGPRKVRVSELFDTYLKKTGQRK